MSDHSTPSIQWEGKFLRVLKCGRWEYADRVGATGGVVIVAITNDGKLILTEQYRIPVTQRVIELPAGLAGNIHPPATERSLGHRGPPRTARRNRLRSRRNELSW